jgi:hypothetical protein
VGTVHWRAEAEADATTFRVKDGDLEFGLTPKLREVLDQALTRELSAAGFKDVELEIAPGGAVSLKNATYEVRAKGRSGNKGTEIEIPLLSRLLKKPRKLTHVSAQLDLKPRVENNQLVVELDDLKMKGLIAQLVNKIVDGEDKLSDQIETQLKAEQIKYTRKDGESVFRIDLNDLLQKQIDPGIRLTEAQLTPEGQVKIGYTYQQTKP